MQISSRIPTIAELMVIEKATFSGSPLAFTPEDYELELATPGMIFVSAYDGEKLVGIAGAAPAAFSALGKKERQFTPEDAIYFWNLAVLPEYQGRGIGQQLVWERVRLAMQEGYTIGAGHYREGASEHIARKYIDVIAEFKCPKHSGDGTMYTYLTGSLVQKF